MKQIIRWNILSIFLALFLWGAVGIFSASAAELPYSFRVEWASLTDEEGGTLHPPAKSAVVAVLWLLPSEGYHTYDHAPGEEAMPTVVTAPGADVRYVPGISRADVFGPDVTVRVYDGPTPVFLLFGKDAVPASAEVSIDMLACSSENCFPVSTSVPLGNPSAAVLQPLSDRPEWLEALRRASPGQANVSAVLSEDRRPSGQESPPPASSGSEEKAGDFGEFRPRAYQASLEVGGLGKALLLGLFAGLLLNVMPCVLPVLTLKISSLLIGGGQKEETLRRFREHNLFFSAGILTWFGALALLFGLADMAWGQLFQSNVLLFIMMLLVFCLGLSMFDVFHLPVLDIRVGTESSSPRVQAYSTGLLATLLATPCSGPLLGGVLGWSMTQTLPVLMTVFLATGLGMALPYLLLAWRPSFAARLPRPGAWMLVFEKVLGFFLMGTVLYLLSLLPVSMRDSALAVLLVAAAAAWVWGRWGSLRGTLLRRACIGGGGLAALGLAVWICFSPAAPAVPWQPFQKEAFRAALGRTAMLVEFTADWCPTCKVLERTVLTRSHLLPLIREFELELIRVDMTRADSETRAFLRALGSASIPVLAVFPPGRGAAEPVILRDLYTVEQLQGAVHMALETP